MLNNEQIKEATTKLCAQFTLPESLISHGEGDWLFIAASLAETDKMKKAAPSRFITDGRIGI